MSDKLELNIPELTSEIPEGSFGIVAARPGGGKTAFSLWVAFSKALKGESVALVSFELTDEEIYNRLIRFAKAHGADPKEILKNLLFQSVSLLSFEAFEAFIEKLLKAEDLTALVIDDSFQVFGDQTEISKFLKSAALEYGTTVFLTSQLTRNDENQIYGSSEIVAYADFIFTLKKADTDSHRKTKFCVFKNRYGILGEKDLVVDYMASGFYEEV